MYTQRQQRDLISLLYFFQNKETSLETGSRDSPISIGMGYGLDGRGSIHQIIFEKKILPFSQLYFTVYAKGVKVFI
jgi:hypothetical protein